MADDETVERFIADVDQYVDRVRRAAREADHFGAENQRARERVTQMGHSAQEAAERAARAQAQAAREAERLARGQGNAERAARAQARAQRLLERAQIAQSRAARQAAQQTENEAEQYRELARAARRAAAAQRLAQMRAAGQIRQHNELLRRLRQQYDDFGEEAGEAFREMETRGRRAANRLSGLLGKIPIKWQAALLLLPLAAATAASGIVLAVGGGVSAAAILVAAKSKQVKREFDGLKKHVVSSVKAWAKPWEDTVSHMIDYAGDAFDDLAPYIKRAFADMAPVVERFSGELLHAFRHFGPMLDKFRVAFRAMMSNLGPAMDDLIKDLADGLGEIADAVEDNPEALAEFAKNLGTVAKAAGYLIGLLTRLEQVNRLLPSGLSQWRILGDQWNKLRDSAQGLTGHTLVMNGALRATAAATDRANATQSRSQILMQLASQSADKLKASLDKLAGKTLTAREAAANYGLAVQRMSQSLKDNGKAHGFNTKKGIENEQALTQMARAAQDNAVAMRDNGAKAKDVAKFMEQARKKFVQSAVAAGYSKDEANKLADKLYGVTRAANTIPKRKHTDVTADTSQAKSTVERFKEWVGRQIARIHISSIWPFATGGIVPAFAAGGPVDRAVARFPTGGPVRGPGTSTSDSITARLSAGEFVVNAAATRAFRPLLEMINRSGLRRTPTPAPMMAAVGPTGGGTTVVQYVTNVHVAGSVWSERELWDVVQRQSGQFNTRNPGTNPYARGGGGF